MASQELTTPPEEVTGSMIGAENGEGEEAMKRSSLVDRSLFAKRKSHALIIKGPSERLGLSALVNLISAKTKYSAVTLEQINRVRVMHDTFKEGAEFSFNYNCLLLVASILAGLGLASNSSTTIIASMLVSPIMGPVVGMAYGITIHDWQLCRTALKTELISLFVCVMMGMIIAGCTGWTDIAADWPNSEMSARAQISNFWIGFPVAFFSGFGVAVSLLDDSTSSLVGVAISASLLPPAVNAGMLWVAWSFYSKGILPESPVDSNSTTTIVQVDYMDKEEFQEGGFMSLGLTLVNVVLIIISSCIMFRLKERLPLKHKKVFWTDLGVARKIYMNRAYLEGGDDEVESSDTPEIIDGIDPIMENPRAERVQSAGSAETPVPLKHNTVYWTDAGVDPTMENPGADEVQSVGSAETPVSIDA